MKTFYISSGLLFEDKDLAIITTNSSQLTEMSLEVDTFVKGTVHVDATCYGEETEVILETSYTGKFDWLDRTDIADYTPQVLFDINQDGWVETQIDVDYFKETDEPFYVATNVRMSEGCNFKFEDLSMDLQKKIVEVIESRINE